MNKNRLPLLEESIQEKDVSNGIYNIKSSTPMSGFYVIYKGGASIETDGNRGIAHLMEHLMCRSFEQYDDQLTQNGVFTNAFTCNDRVAFFIKGIDRYVNEFKQKLVESMFNFNITEEEFEIEKQIILEEYDMSFDSRTDIHFYNTFRKLFNFYCAIGKRSDIENYTLEQFNEFHDLHFSKPHQIINISEKYPYKENVDMAENFTFRRVGIRKTNEDAVYEASNYDGNNASIIFVSPMIEEKDMAVCDVVTKMINGGLHSPLMEELRGKRGLVYYVNCAMMGHNDNNGNVLITTQSSEKNVETIKSVTESVLSNPDKFMTQSNFLMVKSNMLINKEKGKIFNFGNIDEHIYENIHVNNIIDNVTLEDCRRVYDKYFNFENWIKSVDKDDFGGAANESKKVVNRGLIKLFENKTIKI